MKVDGTHYRSVWHDRSCDEVRIIDQRWLPHDFRVVTLASRAAVATAIREMWVRGAPLIGATAAYGIALQMRDDPSDRALEESHAILHETRPTAINLRWSLDRVSAVLRDLPPSERAAKAFELAATICDEDVEICRRIGEHGLGIIREVADAKPAGEPVRVLTHCNAGWLATVDWGTATAPIFHAFDAGIPLHVWVGETRPRNQGALTAWEMVEHGVNHAYVVDNAGGHLMQCGDVDLVIVGSDRTTASGDVCNKIGTYLKALAAYDNKVPFYVALPSPTIDWRVHDGLVDIPIEERPAREISHQWGRDASGALAEVAVPPDASPVGNPAFDVTPARLVSGLITERGVCQPTAAALAAMFPDLVQADISDP